MILFVAANTGFGYILASKSYYEQNLPSGAAPQYDEWTESKNWWPSNATNTNVSESNDALNGGFYGNKSIEFNVTNGKQIYMQINFNQSIDCSGADGYTNMSFRVKMIYPNTTTTLENATMYLLSSKTDYFRYNLTGYSLLSNSTLWYNLTIPIGPTRGWTNSSNNADWSNIISLKYDFSWSENANLTVRLDGLFFRGIFKNAIEETGTSSLLNYSLLGFMQFVITWVLLGGLMFIISKGLGGKALWKPIVIVAGFALIVLFVQMMINVVLGANLPNLYYPLEFRGGVNGEGQSAFNKLVESTALASQISSFVDIAVIFWIVALCAFAIRQLTEFSWSKSFLIAVVAYFISVIVGNFILTL
jgi:hypothetical protein